MPGASLYNTTSTAYMPGPVKNVPDMFNSYDESIKGLMARAERTLEVFQKKERLIPFVHAVQDIFLDASVKIA